MIQLVLLIVLGALVIFVLRQALAIFTRPGISFPTGRLAIVFMLCLLAGAVVAFIVGFLFYPVLPRGLMQARGLAFGGVALITALVLYDRAKAWLIAKSQHDL